MNEALVTALTQWGMAGVAIFAAAYVIWNNHKEEQKNKKRYEAKLEELNKKSSTRDTMSDLKNDINSIGEKIDTLSCAQDECRTKLVDMGSRINVIEEKIENRNSSHTQREAERLMKLTKLAPTIHTVIQNNMDEMNADHIFVALLHNGTKSLTGIPFVKMDVIVEKYNPLENPNDIEYSTQYTNEEITRHDKLPGVILHKDFVDIKVNEDGYSQMDALDAISAREMRKIGTKRIMFECIRDSRTNVMGFVCAYSYKTEDMNVKSFRSMVKMLERLYRDVSNI